MVFHNASTDLYDIFCAYRADHGIYLDSPKMVSEK